MSEQFPLPDEITAAYRYAFEHAKADREGYFNLIKDEIKIAVDLINKYDKIYVLGGLGARLLQSSPNFYNQFMKSYDGPDKEHAKKEEMLEDDEIEILLEYAMSIASASPNTNAGILPTLENIEVIRKQLSKIKFNVGFYETTADKPNDNEFDHWLKLRVMEDALHVRGDGYHSHLSEIYKEMFAPHDGFLIQYYGFDSNDILNAIQRLDILVASKQGNAFGGSLTHQRFTEWSEEKGQETIAKEMHDTGRHFMQQFTSDNPDLYDEAVPDGYMLIPFDCIIGYNKMFWIIPKNEKERKIFGLLSHQFEENIAFLQGKFGGFPLGDTLIQTKPLIKVGDKFYCFNIHLAFRNIFEITANLLQSADAIYHEQKFKNNQSANSRDNYIELKSKLLFEKLLPTVQFYHSLDYNITENGLEKKPELDILGLGNDTLYIIEVKAGELNKKHRRGALMGLKDRIKETVNEGSYQCHRAEKFITDNASPEFSYIDNNQRKILKIDKSKNYRIIKISVTYEHFSTVSVNLKYLIESGVFSSDYKWTWIVSLLDLMIFADLIESEQDFKEYLQNRFALYDRDDYQFQDEIDILGVFFDKQFPLPETEEGKKYSFLHIKKTLNNTIRKGFRKA
ncbi:MAG: hypothetical protein IPN88_17265 [Bacteroidetes bacterium]|nr:hypothetical protein [Bacteroidota bacterium]